MKPIHLNVRETDMAHQQLTEMMEISNMQFVQINGCDITELMAGANKRPVQGNDNHEKFLQTGNWQLKDSLSAKGIY